MNPIHPKTLEKANDAAIYTLYLYLSHKTNPTDGETLQVIVSELEAASKTQNWSAKDKYRLHILKNAVNLRASLAEATIGSLTRSKSGMTACSFTNPDDDVFVVFRGTGSGEWLDNGEGLSGIPEENTYITYGENGDEVFRQTVQPDYATDQQVEALNWFHRIAAQNRWNTDTRLTLAGHSKGGNKAQFVAIHSDLVDDCFSFHGQGFSPEALAAFKKRHDAKFTARRRNIKSLSANNDYVNVLGERLMPDTQIHYFTSSPGLHDLESMLDSNGHFRAQSQQGSLSTYVQTVSEKLMRMPPAVRQYMTLGVMSILQRYLGQGTPVNADTFCVKTAISRIAVAIGAFLDSQTL